MTHIYDDPAEFKNDVIKGFAAAYPQYVQRVEGASGFVRAGGPLEGKVSLVIGGGSGHYPSYNGVVGTGFADGAVLGDMFASPSAEQVYRIAKAADGGAGVVLGFGNYAGDRLNFGVAAERLINEGIDTRIVYVTDDVASASREEQEKRRGIAGTFTVYKMAAAAAENGANLDEVERVMRAANAATYSFGVAFHGCTLPGADKPLFTVDEGHMDFGLGIHGEPGITLGSLDVGQGPGCQARRDGPRRASGGSERSGCGAPQRAWRHQVRGTVRVVRPRQRTPRSRSRAGVP